MHFRHIQVAHLADLLSDQDYGNIVKSHVCAASGRNIIHYCVTSSSLIPPWHTSPQEQTLSRQSASPTVKFNGRGVWTGTFQCSGVGRGVAQRRLNEPLWPWHLLVELQPPKTPACLVCTGILHLLVPTLPGLAHGTLVQMNFYCCNVRQLHKLR